MATLHTIKAVFQDYWGDLGIVTVKNATSLSDAESLLDTVEKYTRAKKISYSHTETVSVEDDSFDFGTLSAEHYNSCKQKCKVIFKDTEKNCQVSMQIPAPNDNCFDEDQQPTSDLAEDIKDLLASVTTSESGDFQYRGGGLVSKLPAANKRRTKMTGV